MESKTEEEIGVTGNSIELNTKHQETNEQVIEAKVKPDNYIDVNAEVVKDRGVYRVEQSKSLLDSQKNGLIMKAILGTSILVCAWASSLDSSVTSSLSSWATSSYQKHSMGLGATQIAVSIITAVSKPVLGRIANVISRPSTYIISILFYTVGYIIVSAGDTISAYIVGVAITAVGSSGIGFMNDLTAADMSVLKWRGLATAMLSTPYIINTWYAGYIVQDLGTSNWRWGYGMFCIIMPVVIAPATIVMLYLENRAKNLWSTVEQKNYKLNISFRSNWKKMVWKVIIEVDVFGLLLLGFGFSLVLLPLSLYLTAQNGWKNPSIIAMIVVGGVLLIVFFFYEAFFAPFPIVPKRVLNRTLICSIIIDFFYQFGGMIPLVYLSSYAYIVQDWPDKDWTYFNNTLTMALCVIGVVAGICLRYTHRYKIFQIFGVILSILGSGIMIDGKNARTNTLSLVWSQILDGAGGGFNVVATGVALQACVPHRDISISMAILSLCSYIGQSIGSAVASAIWTGKMYNALRKHIPDTVSDEEVYTFYSTYTTLRKYPMHGEVRQGAIKAYSEVSYYFFCICLGLQFIRLIAVLFQSNYYLGDQQNAVEGEDSQENPDNKKSWKEILLDVF